MTKDEAREILNNYVQSPTFTELPIVDVNLGNICYDDGLNVRIESYSFKGLLKIAYDLK